MSGSRLRSGPLRRSACARLRKADSRDRGGFGEGFAGRERALDPNAGPGAFFGSELRRCRKKAGLSQPQLGERTTYSPDMIGKIERGERPPSSEFVRPCDFRP
ncbi:helix-turn-helix domain-containing protein [Sphaerisporangium siamense]|uniref:helix-turn-helix domain-containing protein n=1 Tax=Sphaerisporangium siamense TaxID=795645 RepID=UPI0035A25FF4